MNLNDIMERDIRDAEREQRERADRENAAADHSRPGETMLAVADWALRLLNTATLLFIAWCLVSETPHKVNGHNQHADGRECAPAK